LIWVAVFTVVALTHIAPLLLLTDPGIAHGFASAQIDAAAYFLLRLHGIGYDVALVFFGADCLLLGILIWRSNFLPKLFGALLALAGVCYLTNSFSDFLYPALSDALGIYLLLPCAVAEWGLTLWLLVAGVNTKAWMALAKPDRAAE
jgi:hypothetical protein